VALWVPELFEHTEPSWSYIHRGDVHANLYQSYIAAREADLPVALVRERDMVVDGAGPARAKLYLLPCAKLVTAPGMKLAMRLADEGATIFASYFAGSQPGQRGPWMPWLERAFGVRHHLRYGLADAIDDTEVTFEIVTDLGELVVGTRLSFGVGGNANARAYLPVEADGAQVLAVDGHGRPALLRYRTGKGAMVLCTYPIEHMASERPRANPEPTWRLYSALATSAGVSRPLRAEDPRVTVGGLKVGERDVFVALNLSPDNVTADLLSDGRSILSADGATVTRLALAPYEVAVLYLDAAGR
jgi:hypothetical protein